MAIPIAPHTISLASLFLLLLLASALQPGLMAAPLSVAVQTPPIEQNIERRELELKIYARRMVKHPSKLEVVQTNTLQPNEWLEIILGKEQILDIVAKSKNEWRIDPAKLPSPSSIKTDTEIHSTFLIGTVYFPSLFIKEKLFGNPLSSLRRAEIHGILQVVSEISEPATPVDRILAVVAIVHWIESLETSNPGVRFVRAVDPTTLDSSPIFDLYISARFDWQHYIQFDPWWDTKELFSSDEARDEVNAWFRNSPEEKVEVPDYYKLKPHNM